MALTQDQINIVKSTAPLLKAHGETITTLFYKDMINTHPELRNLFSLRNQASGAQPRALASAVLAYATYIDDLPRLAAAVERIAHKHASLYVRPEQYDIVGHHLLKAIAAVLGDALTPAVADAWTAAYAQLARVFVDREADLYRDAGPWTGWRRFRVARRVDESDVVTSFYLAPVDNGAVPLPAYLPGQYISLRVPVPELGGIKQPRQYSLSEAYGSGEYYRISVKRETADLGKEGGVVEGLVSNLLHREYGVGDEVEVSHPQGDVFLDVARAADNKVEAPPPLVLVSAGVGATPLMAMLEAASAATPRRPVRWVHAARNSGSLVFGRRVRELARAPDSNIRAHVFLSEVREGDRKGWEYDFGGQRFDLARLSPEELGLGDEGTEYFVCGPREWMVEVRRVLEGMGVERGRVRLEVFGTGDAED